MTAHPVSSAPRAAKIRQPPNGTPMIGGWHPHGGTAPQGALLLNRKGLKMMNSALPGIVVFGILLATTLIGLMTSSANAARLNGSSPTNDNRMQRPGDPLTVSDTAAMQRE